MKENKLRIGEIPFANLFPIFYTLKKEFDCSSYEFIEGAPSKLNRMLREGAVDLSPSSSIEYLKNPSLYRLIEGHSISSQGEVGSILFFTKKPIEELDSASIDVSSQSETSVALLDIVLRKFYGIKCRLLSSDDPEHTKDDAFLLIGDDALRYGAEERNRTETASHLVYDLGELWYRNTGLPFVFALWIVRAELGKDEQKLLDRFMQDLNSAKEIALNNLPDIAKHSPMKAFMTEGEILSYWNRLDYELSDEHKKGLELFRKYLGELSYF